LWHDAAALAWLIAFQVAFFAQELPNNRPLTRHRLARAWVQADPLLSPQPLVFELMDTLDPPDTPEGPPRGWNYLTQRLPLWGAAALILSGSWGLGVILLRTLRLGKWSAWEELTLGCLLGLCGVSLSTLGLGLCGMLWQPLFIALLTAAALVGAVIVRRDWSTRESGSAPREWMWLLAAAPFLIAIAFGSVSPPTDFDVQEYHLGGPKEWFLQGRIAFLSHNVYTSFPFFTEMLLLCGMAVSGDWYWGGVAGQAVLAAFAPLTALGLWQAARRWWSPRAGLLAAFIYLSTPWVYRISIIAYSEGGLTAYLFAALWVTLVAIERLQQNEPARGVLILAGLFAGSAMACKYPGLISVVIPLAGAIALIAARVRAQSTLAASRWTSIATSLGWFLLGTTLTIGPWLLKNLVETGNPVYPLAYSIFDGRDLDDALAEKWRSGHPTPALGSVPQAVRSAAGWAWDIAAINDWQSPLVVGFAVWSIWVAQSRRHIAGLWLYALWLFAFWWAGTHRIDRFWVPMLPVLAWLAGIGAASAARPVIRWATLVVIALCGLFNLSFCVTGLGGYNAGLTELNYARNLAARITGPEIAWLNDQFAAGALPANTRVLFVGEAEHFPATFPYLYNTVFDRPLFEEWCAERDPDEIRAAFAAHGVTHVLVNWSEVLRYRMTYGYTDFVHPARFAALQQADIFGAPLELPLYGELPMGLKAVAALSRSELDHLRAWAPELIVPCGDEECFVAAQIFPVNR
jgi:hypothetical protein